MKYILLSREKDADLPGHGRLINLEMVTQALLNEADPPALAIYLLNDPEPITLYGNVATKVWKILKLFIWKEIAI